MDKIEFWKRMANEQASKTLYVKIPPVLDEILQGKGNKSQYVIDLIIADFQYVEGGRVIVEDVKGMETAVFKLKRKLFLFTYPDVELRIV